MIIEMKALVSKAEIESEITDRFGVAFQLREKVPAENLSTGIPEVDTILSGLPRGAITEVFGLTSSGRTSFMLSALAHATNEREVCALVDTNDAFDPASAAGTSMVFDQLLWVRCGTEGVQNVPQDKRLEQAFKATDLLLQSGGFGLVALDLSDIVPQDVRRIISSWWFRFRRAIENSPTSLIVTAPTSCVGSRASLAVKMDQEGVVWSAMNASSVFPEPDEEPKGNVVIPLYSIPETQQVSGHLSTNSFPVISAKLRQGGLLHGLNLKAERQRPVSFRNRQARYHTLSQAQSPPIVIFADIR